MKVLFTKRIKKQLLKTYEYVAALCVLFVVLSYFSVPTILKGNINEIEGAVSDISLKREHTWARTAGSKGYIDYYDIFISGVEKPFRSYSLEELKMFGLDSLKKKEVRMIYFQHDDYKVINKLYIDSNAIIKSIKIGIFPFALFVGLAVITLVWSIWGFYITYLASDEKRKEVLGE